MCARIRPCVILCVLSRFAGSYLVILFVVSRSLLLWLQVSLLRDCLSCLFNAPSLVIADRFCAVIIFLQLYLSFFLCLPNFLTIATCSLRYIFVSSVSSFHHGCYCLWAITVHNDYFIVDVVALWSLKLFHVMQLHGHYYGGSFLPVCWYPSCSSLNTCSRKSDQYM